jgi:hypothetical protein
MIPISKAGMVMIKQPNPARYDKISATRVVLYISQRQHCYHFFGFVFAYSITFFTIYALNRALDFKTSI